MEQVCQIMVVTQKKNEQNTKTKVFVCVDLCQSNCYSLHMVSLMSKGNVNFKKILSVSKLRFQRPEIAGNHPRGS